MDVALILGHAAATYLIDDVTIVQKEAPASAAAITLDFEEDEHLAQETETSVAVRMPEGEKLIDADLASTAAAHSGKVGASVTVNEIITPAWHGRLELGWSASLDVEGEGYIGSDLALGIGSKAAFGSNLAVDGGAVLKTATAGQLQALLDFLRPRVPRGRRVTRR